MRLARRVTMSSGSLSLGSCHVERLVRSMRRVSSCDVARARKDERKTRAQRMLDDSRYDRTPRAQYRPRLDVLDDGLAGDGSDLYQSKRRDARERALSRVNEARKWCSPPG